MTVTLVSGASSGIGRSLAFRLAASGSPVVLVARRRALLDEAAAAIIATGGRALAVAADVTDRAQAAAAVHAAEAAFGPVERLIANAGGGEKTDVEHFTAEHVDRILRLNVVGTATLIEAALPGMLARRQGHLVAVGSLAGYRGLPRAAAYCAAKAAVWNLMEGLRLDLRGHGVDVTLLLPGFVRTDPERKKRKPFEMDLEAATARMERAILARRRVYAFPWPLVSLMRLGRLLPPSLYDGLIGALQRRRA